MQASRNHYILLSTLTFSLVFTTPVNAQNYRLLNENRDLTFARLKTTGMDSIYYFIQVDSFEVSGTDSIFYFNYQLQNSPEPECDFIYNDTILLGNRVVVTSDTDGTYIFFNQQNDSIFIKSTIKNGDTWKMYKWPDGSYVKATVVNHIYGGIINGLFDSLYRVKLNVFTAAGAMLTSVFPNDTKIDISENYGLVETFNLNIFPLPGDSLARVTRGITNPDVGIVDVNAQHAFNFNTGYEYHYREEVAPDLIYDVDKRISAFKYFVLAKTLSPTNASYSIERIQFDTLYTDDGIQLNIIWDTINLVYNYTDYAFLDTPELKVFNATNAGYSDWMKDDTIFAGIPHKYVYDWYQFDEGTRCLSNPELINMPEQLYGEGLGVMHYLDSTDNSNYYKLDMQYFKLGLSEWGNPYDFSVLDNSIFGAKTFNEFKIYPNPTNNYIKLPEYLVDLNNCQFYIYNPEGKTIKSGESDYLIDVSSLTNGVYFIQVITTNGTWNSTFVKQNY